LGDASIDGRLSARAGTLEGVAAAGTAQSEALFRFLDKLGQEVSRATDADEIMAITTRLTAQHLGLSNCAYADMDEDQDGFTIRGNWHAPGSPSIIGHYSLTDFGKLAVQELSAGRPLVINDNLKEISPSEAETFQRIGIGATICMPLVKHGRLTALMAIHDKDPHYWSDYELAVIQEVTNRSWAHVERVRAQAQLLESEAKFHAIANSIDQMVWSTRPDGFHDYYNERWYEYTGVPPGSTDGEAWNGMFHPDDQDRAWQVWRHSLETGEPYHIEYRLRHRTGDYRWVIGRAQCVREPDGRISRWYGTCTDIHDQKIAEEQVRRNHDTFYNLIQNNPFGVYVVDADFRLAEASQGSQNVFGGIDPLIGRDFAEVLRIVWAEPFATEAIARFRHTLATGEPYSSPATVETRGDRQTIEAYDWRIERIELPSGGHGVVCYFYDLSERLQFEQRLKLSEERYRRIFEQTSDLILTADLNQIITDCNPSAAIAVGLKRSEAIGRAISDFISPEDFDRTTAMLSQKLEEGGTTRYDVRVRSSTGEWLFWEINSGLTYGEDGNPVGLHVVGRDISERKRFERQQQMLVGELNHRVKNTLAIVQSLAHQTFEKGAESAGPIRSFEGRLQALAAAHNLLTRKSWEAASMREVVTEAVSPFCAANRVVAEGPMLMLPPSTAVALALATHELATNAAKYGALSNDSGRVSIRWTLDADTLTFVWREEGGPAVARVERSGFGTRLIKRTLAAELRGRAELDFEPAGLVCKVEAPLPSWQRPATPD
jgi:PAS domain S-box-containing protein